jgi:hypothetical protein
MPHTIHTPPTLLLQVLAIFLAGGLPPINPSASAPHSAVMIMSSSSARSRLGNPVTLFVGGLKPGQTKHHIVQTPFLFNAYSSHTSAYCCDEPCSTNMHSPALVQYLWLTTVHPFVRFNHIFSLSDIFVSIFKSIQVNSSYNLDFSWIACV